MGFHLSHAVGSEIAKITNSCVINDPLFVFCQRPYGNCSSAGTIYFLPFYTIILYNIPLVSKVHQTIVIFYNRPALGIRLIAFRIKISDKWQTFFGIWLGI